MKFYIKEWNKLISFFKEQYDNVFFLYNIYFLEGNNEDTELLNKISKPFIFTEYRKTKIYDCGGFDFFLENFLSDYTKFEKFIKNNIRLFSVITISNEIKTLNDVSFSIMNK